MTRDLTKVEPKTVIILTEEEYSVIVGNLIFLNALKEAGVDNWEGYSQAYEIYREKLGH